MKRFTISLASLLLTACATAPVLDVAAAPQGAYRLDPAHASVNWSLSHSGLSLYTARFDDISGALDFNASTRKASQRAIQNGTRRLQQMAVILTETPIQKFASSQYLQQPREKIRVWSRGI
jgi:polyisoprenoid-binding protein YceI